MGEFSDKQDKIYKYSEDADTYIYTNNFCPNNPLKPIGEWGWCRETVLDPILGDYITLAPRDHFWDADTGSELPCPVCIPSNKSAREKALEYWERAKNKYAEGDKDTAYELFGAVVHLLSDMGSPAHVHNDWHVLPEIDEDSIENYVEDHFPWESYQATQLLTYSDLYFYMYYLNQQTAWFPSNDYLGNDLDLYGIHHPAWHTGWPEYTPDDLTSATVKQDITEIIVPLTIKYVASLFQFFYEQFQPTLYAPSTVVVLNSFTVEVGGTIDNIEPESWEWDFDYDGIEANFNTDASGKSVQALPYKSTGNKKIGLRVSASGHTPKIITRDITVKQYPIEVEYPDGFESLHRHFSTPENSHIEEYKWNYGDGSPEETGSSRGNTFPTSKDYTVTLTLTLDDNSTITSQEVIFVGPGERLIPGHTITGDETWYTGGTYKILGSITVAQGGRLTIQPGTRVELYGGSQIYVSGTLTATGATFTWADGVNQWNGILFAGAGASGSRLENCVLEHATGAYGLPGIIRIESSSPTITGCTINNSVSSCGISMVGSSAAISNCTISGMQYNGLYLYNQSSPGVTGCTITNNQTGIYVDNSSSCTVTGCNITGNLQYGVYYSGNDFVDATNNYWGNPSGPYDPSDDRASGGLYNPTGLGNRVSYHVNYYPWAVASDADNDGFADDGDNCPTKPNGPDLGTCSSGSDKSGIICTTDADCANGCSSNGECLKTQDDADNDGVGDVCDNCPANCNSQQLDANGNGLGDVCDIEPGCGGCSWIGCETEC